MYLLRQSMLNDYLQCPQMCYHRWKEYGVPGAGEEGNNDEEEQSNKYAEMGTAFHETMEHWAINKKNGISLSYDDLAADLVRRVANVPIDLFDCEDDKVDYEKNLLEQLKWVRSQWCNGTPIGVETKFTNVELIPGLPNFSGTIDRIDGSIERREVVLIDYKTGKTHTKAKLAKCIQAVIYSLRFKQVYGFYPSHFIFLFSKAKKEKSIAIDEEYIQNGVDYIKEIWNKIISKQFRPPYKRNTFFCNHFCNYKDVCVAYIKVPEGWKNVGS